LSNIEAWQKARELTREHISGFMLAAEISKMIGGLMNYMRQSKLKGIKYKK
jgi:hypothetical protein